MSPHILYAFKQTNCGSLFHIVVALDVQTLDDASDRRKSGRLVLLMKLQQMTRKISERAVKQILRALK